MKELSPSVVVRTHDRKFKILDVSSATNVLGMESSVSREIVGNPIYLDHETYIAQIQGDSHVTQNHFKSSVYALGITLLEIYARRSFDRRQTSSDIELYLNEIRQHHSDSIAELIALMLQPNRADRPDCLELFQKVLSVSDLPEVPKFQSHDQPKIISPPILNQLNFQMTHQTNPLGIQSTNSEYIWMESKHGETMTSQDFQYTHHNPNDDINLKFTQSHIKEQDPYKFTLTQTYKSNDMLNTNLASMTSQIKLSDSLRKKVKQYQEQSGQQQFNQQTLTEIQSYDGEASHHSSHRLR